MRKTFHSLAWSMAAALAVAAPARADEPAPLHTQQPVFRVPFHIDPPQEANQAPKEVQLHFSDNQRDWKLAGVVEPNSGGLVFRAPCDGEYWFVVRTIDQLGRMQPPVKGPTVPEMKVIVDTAPPQMELQAGLGPAGEIIIQWHSADPNLASERPTIEYRLSESAAQWQPVAVAGGAAGQATLPAMPGAVNIRARIADKAGNESKSEVRVGSSAKPAPYAPVVNAVAPPIDINPPAPAKKAAPAPVAAAPSNTAPSYGAPSNTAPSYASAAPAPYTTAKPPVEITETTAPAPRVAQPAPQPVTPKAPPVAEVPLPPGVTPQVVNSLRFTLDYDVEAVGPSGLGKIELWGTQDAGKTWKRFGSDPDLRSPIGVNAPAEGTYGFRMVIENNTGIGDKPPVPGDVPDVWITVDTSKPEAQLLSVEGAQSGDNSEMVIQWQAADRQLSARPVSLYFSAANGQWYPIATGLTNTGSYAWKLGDRVPREVQIRLKVRDEAGNETVIDSSDSIVADRLVPRSRIQAVKPIGARNDRTIQR